MPVAHITITTVSDEGDNVIVFGTPQHAAANSTPVGYVFQTKGELADVGLAEQVSRLEHGTEVVIDYVPLTKDWNLARGLSVS